MADRFRPGAFGENLVIEGVAEPDGCLGESLAPRHDTDGFEPGTSVLLEVERPFRTWRPERRVQDTGRSGWYFRVLEPGTIVAGQTARLADRPHPEWPLTRVSNPLYHAPLDVDALAALAGLSDFPGG